MVPFFLVAADVQIVVVVAAVRQAMNQPRIAVERENRRLIFSEDGVEGVIGESVRMFARGLESHEIHDVNNANFRSGRFFRRKSTAARVSSVGTSPQHAITTSGSPP